jgi:hypothetical protein
MGSLYAILGVFGLAMIGIALITFAAEGDKKYRFQLGGFLIVFAAAAVGLWYAVEAFLLGA